MRLAPNTLFTLAAIGFIAAVAACVWVVARAPYIGVRLQPAPGGSGLAVTAVAPASPASGRLQVGDVITAFGTFEIGTAGTLLRGDPDELRSHADLRVLATTLERLREQLLQPPVRVLLASGHAVELEPTARTNLAALSGGFWLQLLAAACAFLVTVGVWAFRPRNPVNVYFAISGVSLTAATLLTATLAERHFGVTGEWFVRVVLLRHVAANLFVASFAALCWIYPRRLAGATRVPLLFAAVAGWWIADLLGLWPDPRWSVHGPQLVGATGIAALLLAQRRACVDAGERRHLRWFAAPIIVGIGLYLGLYTLPLALGTRPVAPGGTPAGALALLYLALGFGIYRRGLLNVDRWIAGAWLMFTALVVLLTLDFLLVALLDVEHDVTLAIAVVALAWLYLPLRQWVWRAIARLHGPEDFRVPLSNLLALGLARDSALTPLERWTALLRRRFEPLDVRKLDLAPERARLAQGGGELHVPAPPGLPGLALCFPDRGARLFAAADVREVELLAQLFGRLLEFRTAAAAGARAERARMAQDLHDDVAPPLLSFIYRAEDTASAERGRAAMAQLRRAIRELQENSA